MRRKFKRNVKRLGILSSPVILGAILVLSMLSGPVGAATFIAGWNDETPSDGLIGGSGAVRTTIAVIGINLWTDTADTLTSVGVEMTDVGVANFDPNTEIANTYLFYDQPASTNAVWDPFIDTQLGVVSGAVWGGPPYQATITVVAVPPPPLVTWIPADDAWENEGSDFFIVVQSAAAIDDLDDFTVGVPNGGILTSAGALAGSFTSGTITCDEAWPNVLPGSGTDILGITSDMPTYFDDEDTDNIWDPPLPGTGDCIFFNDYPGEGSDQVTTITINGYTEINAYSFYGFNPYFNEDPIDYAPTFPYSGPFSIDYKLTWTEADTNPASGLNSITWMGLILEDRVGYNDWYMWGDFAFIQDDDPPLSLVDLNSMGTGLWYYDEGLTGNYLPYVDENNQIWVYTTDQWMPSPGSGFDKLSSHARFRIGVERNGAESYWNPPPAIDPDGDDWVVCDEINEPAGVSVDIQTYIVGDGVIGGDPHGYYFIEFDVQDDVGNTFRSGDGTFEILDVWPWQSYDSDKIYFKIMRDFSVYHAPIVDNTNGYTISGTETFEQAALSVGNLDIPALSTLELYDTEVFLDSSFDGERHVDVQGTLTTDSMANSAGYDGRSAFTHRGVGPHVWFWDFPDAQYTFWVRDNAVLDMSNTIVEGCGFATTDQTQDDRGLYIRTDSTNANIDSSEFRFNYAGIVVQDGGGATINNCEIWQNNDIGVYAINSPTTLYIYNSDIHDNGDEGIFLDGSYAEIDNNTIHDNGDMGIRIESGEFQYGYPGGNMGWALITDNHIYDNGDEGIYIENSFYAPESAHGSNSAFYSGTGNDIDRNLTYTFDLSGLAPGSQATLTFWHWYNTADSDDGGNVLYYDDTWARWMPLIPVGSYDMSNVQGYPYGPGIIDGLDNQPGFANENELTYWSHRGEFAPPNIVADGWTQVEYDLTQFSGQPPFELRFRYGTDDRYYATGWFIDDLAIPETGWSWDAESSTGWTLNGWEVRDFVGNPFPETLIENNNISQNSDQGIDMEYSDVDITGNMIWDNDDEGIYLEYFVDALIDNNIIDENWDENIYMYWFVDAEITNNEITRSSTDEGIYIEEYCRALIDNNVITWNDDYGIYAYEFCDLIITNNDISYNYDEALDLEGYGTTFFVDNNVISYNGDEGIYTYECFGLVDAPYEGNYFYWTQGQYDDSHEYLVFDFDLSAVSSATLTFQHAYMTETWCDGAFVDYWDPMTGTWTTLFPVEGYITTEIWGDGSGPNGGYYWGYDGYSAGWRTAEFDLSMFAGGEVRIRFHYVTDGSDTYGGWGIDNIEVPEIGFFDGAESVTPPVEQIVNHGFLRSDGVWNYITNNIIKYNDDEGVYVEETDCYIYNNIISFNDDIGVYVYDYSYVWIENNEITFNDDEGIYIEYQCYVEIRNNNISYNYNSAIYIYEYCQVIIDNNIIEYNYDDEVIYAEYYVEIEITNNYIAYNNKDFWYEAIYLYEIYSSPVIVGNTIIENGYGIYLEDTYIPPPPSGSYAWHTDTSIWRSPMDLSRSFDLSSLTPGDEATLTFWHWYDIDSDAGGTVQVFNTSSNSWMTILPIDYHSYDSSSIPRLFDAPGYGDSDDSWSYEWDVFYETFTGYWLWDGCDDGWIMAQFDLSPWAGQSDVQLRWRYCEDWDPTSGWYIDDIAIPEIGFYDDMESGNTGWTADGWSIDNAAGIIEDNDICNNLGYGIEIDDESYPDIINNRITGNGYDGIYIDEQFDDLYEAIRPAAPSGTHMWYSGYSNLADFQLSRPLDLTGYSEVTLTFYHWYYTESDYDGGVVEVYSNGQWLKAEPRGTYPDEFYYGGEGYAYDNEDWFYAHFDLSQYAGQTIQLRFRWMSDWSSIDTGWYIDDIKLTGVNSATGLEEVIYYDDIESGNAGWTVGGHNIVDNRYGPPKGWSIMETNAIIIADNDISYNGYEEYAGMYLDDYINAIIENNEINHNGVEGEWGPGIYIYEATLSVRNNRIRYNAYNGVYCDYGYGVWQDNEITHNYGTEDDYESGHGVYFYEYSAIFDNNYIADNQHAGMYLEYGDYVIMNNIITNNHWQGIHLYEVGYYNWEQPTYLENNIITNNYMFDRLDSYQDDEWSGVGLFLEDDCYVHVFNGVYSNNERYGIFCTDDVEEFQWIIDEEAEVENNGMRMYSDDTYSEDEFGGGEIYPVLVADGGYLTLKNVRDFQIWLQDDDEYYGIEVEDGGTLDARDTTFDSWYDEWLASWNYYVPNYLWSFYLPWPVLDDDEFDYGQFMDHGLSFTGGMAGTIFATEIPWDQPWTNVLGGEYKVNYRTGEVLISPWTVDGTGSSSMSFSYYYKRPVPYIFRVFGSLYMDDCKVVNTTSLYLESSSSLEVYSTEFTWNYFGGISSVNSNPIIKDCYFHDIDFGIFAEGGTLIIGGSGNTFENCEDAIYLSDGATATIEDNIFDDNVRAITIYDSTVTITDNNIDNCADDGMHIVDSTATITGNSISDCADKAVYLRSSTATMSMNILNNNYFSVYASDTILSMTSDSIAGTTLEDIYSEDGSQVTALDISFDREEVLAVVDSSWVEIQWYTIVEVLDMNGNAFEGADVDVTSSTPSQLQTGADGLTSQFITTEYIQYTASQDDCKPHTITAEGNVTGTIYTGMLSVGITDSDSHTIILNLGPSIETLKESVSFNEDSILYSAFDLDSLFEDDGGDEGMTYWWTGNVRVVITPNPDNVVDLTAASNWNGMEVVVFYASDMWGETISQSINITVNPVNDPPLVTDVKIDPVSPDNMDDLASSYVWYDNVEAEDLEEGSIITWYKSTDGGVNYGKVEELDGETVVPFTATSWGEMWYFTVIPGDDNGGLGDEVASNIVYITRIIPGIYFDDVSIDGDPKETGELTAVLINPQGDTSQTQYQWYRNGELIDGATLDTLSSDYYDEGDTITVSATPFDGYNEGDPVMSSEGVVIMNSPPSLEGVVISPQHPTLVDDLLATPIGYSDPDSRDYTSYENNTNYYHLYYVFEWRVNGEVIPGVTGITLDYAHFDVGDVVRVTVTPSDGEDFGASVTSENVTIGEAEPESDFDGDGIPDDTDIDDDNDGVPDINDVFPFDAKESSDFDKDGIGDNADEDDDNDGFPDGLDFAPKDRDVQWQPWIWLVILILIILLLILAYFKWWRPPKEPKAREEPREEYYPPEEDESFGGEEEMEEDITPPEEEPTSEDVSDDIDKEIAALTEDEPKEK